MSDTIVQTSSRCKLHFIALAAFVDVDNRADIPRHQPVVRNVRGQHNAIVLFNHPEASSNGLAQGQPIALKSLGKNSARTMSAVATSSCDSSQGRNAGFSRSPSMRTSESMSQRIF